MTNHKEDTDHSLQNRAENMRKTGIHISREEERNDLSLIERETNSMYRERERGGSPSERMGWGSRKNGGRTQHCHLMRGRSEEAMSPTAIRTTAGVVGAAVFHNRYIIFNCGISFLFFFLFFSCKKFFIFLFFKCDNMLISYNSFDAFFSSRPNKDDLMIEIWWRKVGVSHHRIPL